MATKLKKSYDLTAKERVEGRPSKEDKEKNGLEKKELPIIDSELTVAAPIWRRVAAYIIDVVLSIGTGYLMIIASNEPSIPQTTRFFILLGALFSQVWFFGLIPGEYWPGQTLGKKLLGIYERSVSDKKTIGIWKTFLRDYVYGTLGIMFTVVFELISLALQSFTNKNKGEKTLQSLPVEKFNLVLPRDTIFKTEVVYSPKAKKERENIAEKE